MNEEIKLLFDECVASRFARDLGAYNSVLYRIPHVVKHLLEFQAAGIKDDVWIPLMAEQGYTFITSDRGRSGGAKLPRECIIWNATHIMLSSTISDLQATRKIGALHSVWGDVIMAAQGPRGERHILRAQNKTLLPFLEHRPVTEKERTAAFQYARVRLYDMREVTKAHRPTE